MAAGTAVANTKNETQAVAVENQKRARMGELVDYFETRRPDFETLLEPGKIDSFMRIFKNAVIKDPTVAEASHSSIFLECQKCAQDGLVLDGREATLTRFKTNKKFKDANGKWHDNWQTEVVYIPMVRGIRKLVSKSPRIASWIVDVVYAEEIAQGRFKFLKGDAPSVYHEPIIVGDRGEPVAVYSIVRFSDGLLHIELMTAEDVGKIKARTKSKYVDNRTNETVITGPWATDETEMWKKTIAHRHFKSIPLEENAAAAIDRVENLYDYTQNATGKYSMPDEAAKPEPKSVANKRGKSVAEKLAAKDEPADQDQDTKADASDPDDNADDDGVIEGEILSNDGQPEDPF